MDFIDYRKSAQKITIGSSEAKPQPAKYRNKKFRDHVEELILEAQQRGEFENLQGTGKPLSLEENNYEGERSLAFHVLKNNGFAPTEIELAKEIRTELERAEGRLAKVVGRGIALRKRRLAPFPGEKRAYNAAVEHTAHEYEKTLRDLNWKILTLNLIAPPALHRPFLDIDALVKDLRSSCPSFTI